MDIADLDLVQLDDAWPVDGALDASIEQPLCNRVILEIQIMRVMVNAPQAVGAGLSILPWY